MVLLCSRKAVSAIFHKEVKPGRIRKVGKYTLQVSAGSHKKGSIVVSGPYSRKMVSLLYFGPKVISVTEGE